MKSTELSVRRQCELLGITRSTVYYEPKQPDKDAVSLKEKSMSRIDYLHTTMPYLGTRKLVMKLREEGYRIFLKGGEKCHNIDKAPASYRSFSTVQVDIFSIEDRSTSEK